MWHFSTPKVYMREKKKTNLKFNSSTKSNIEEKVKQLVVVSYQHQQQQSLISNSKGFRTVELVVHNLQQS